MYNSNLTTPNNGDFIQVIGAGTTIGSYIVAQLTKYAASLVASGITGVVIAFDRTSLQITYARKEERTACFIAMKQNAATQFSLAMDRIENNAHLRPEIRQRLLEEFSQDFGDVLNQITVQFKTI
jgi:Zn-dependent protease with chaperone function